MSIVDLKWDFRFLSIDKKKDALGKIIIMAFTTEDLQKVSECARKLKIPDYTTRPAVDVLYDIAAKLSILEAEIVSPLVVMDKIKEYLKAN